MWWCQVELEAQLLVELQSVNFPQMRQRTGKSKDIGRFVAKERLGNGSVPPRTALPPSPAVTIDMKGMVGWKLTA